MHPSKALFPFGLNQDVHTLHVGLDELPYVHSYEGVETQLLHVDLDTGLWVTRTRLQPGASVIRHLHAGPVLAVTLLGSWHYVESPGQVNLPGSYLFEPAGSVHTLVAPLEQNGPTVAWFAIWGPNINLNPDDTVHSIHDARTVLAHYRKSCAERDLSHDGLIVKGE